MSPTYHEGPLIMAGCARRQMDVPHNVHALNVGQDLPGLAEGPIATRAVAAAGTPGSCGLARCRIFQWNQLC